MAPKGSLNVVGIGIRFAAETTPEALECIKGADRLFFLSADSLAGHWLQKMNGSAESLQPFYAPGKDRSVTYEEMVEHVLKPVFAGFNVCLAAYGHPGAFAYPTHESVSRARAAGFSARMLPGISADACLIADLGIDPAIAGMQSFEASDFLVYNRRHDPRSALILWQIGVIGEWRYKPQDTPWNPAGLKVLLETLLQDYDPRHEVIVYEASPFVVCEPNVQRVPLAELAKAHITPISTLYVPPRETAEPDLDVLRRLGFDVPTLQQPARSASE